MKNGADEIIQQARQVRSEAIGANISFAFTFCKLAENAALSGCEDQAQRLLALLQKTQASLYARIKDPRHMEPEDVQRFREKLWALDQQISRLLSLLLDHNGSQLQP